MAPDTELSDLQSLVGGYDGDNAELGKLAKAIKPVVDYVNQEKAGKQQERFDTDVKEIADFFSEVDGLKGLPEKLTRAFLEGHAQEDPNFNTAFNNKAKNPEAWKTARGKARDAFKGMVSELPNSKGRTGARAAQGLSPEQKMNMPYHEWRQYVEEQKDLAEAS